MTRTRRGVALVAALLAAVCLVGQATAAARTPGAHVVHRHSAIAAAVGLNDGHGVSSRGGPAGVLVAQAHAAVTGRWAERGRAATAGPDPRAPHTIRTRGPPAVAR